MSIYQKTLFNAEGSAPLPSADGMKLPPGYTSDLFAEDVRTVFERTAAGKSGAPQWNGHLRDVPETWATAEECRTGKPPKQWDEERYREAAATWGKTLNRLGRSVVPEYFLDRNNGNIEAAMSDFIQWLAEEQSNGGRPDEDGRMPITDYMRGKSGRPDQGDGKAAASAIASLSRAIEAGDMPSDSDGQGEDAGKSGNAMPVSKQLRIAELLPRARKRYEFAAKKSVKTRNVETPADTFTIRSMNHHAEPTILEESFLYNDDMQMVRWATLQCGVIQHQEVIPEPQHFTMLLDVSASMTEPIPGNNPGQYHRDELAAACVIALAEQAKAGGNEVSVVPFDIKVQTPVHGADAAMQFGWNAGFDGGGTDFNAAVLSTNDSKTDYVVMVTDGDDRLEVDSKAPLHILDVTGRTNPTLSKRAVRYDTV